MKMEGETPSLRCTRLQESTRARYVTIICCMIANAPENSSRGPVSYMHPIYVGICCHMLQLNLSMDICALLSLIDFYFFFILDDNSETRWCHEIDFYAIHLVLALRDRSV